MKSINRRRRHGRDEFQRRLQEGDDIGNATAARPRWTELSPKETGGARRPRASPSPKFSPKRSPSTSSGQDPGHSCCHRRRRCPAIPQNPIQRSIDASAARGSRIAASAATPSGQAHGTEPRLAACVTLPHAKAVDSHRRRPGTRNQRSQPSPAVVGHACPATMGAAPSLEDYRSRRNPSPLPALPPPPWPPPDLGAPDPVTRAPDPAVQAPDEPRPAPARHQARKKGDDRGEEEEPAAAATMHPPGPLVDAAAVEGQAASPSPTRLRMRQRLTCPRQPAPPHHHREDGPLPPPSRRAVRPCRRPAPAAAKR